MSKNSAQVITCKGVVCWGPKEGVKVEEIQVDPPKCCEIRVKMLRASVCHTDFLYTQLQPPYGVYPRVLGHEGVGVVESVGEGVRGVEEGDIVMPTYIGECGDCENCESGETNLCLKYPLMAGNGLMLDGTTRMWKKGEKLCQMLSCSTWCEYTVVNVNYVVKLDPSINLAHASFISCGFSTGYGAAWKEAKVKIGSSLAVFGLGAVGLGVVEGARQQGAVRIIGIDKNEKKRGKGEAFGMTDFINPQDHQNKSISEVVKELTQGIGVDYSMECTGVDYLLNEAIQATKVGRGKTILIGASSSPRMEINIRPILYGRCFKGSIFGGIKTKSDLPFLIQKCINKELHLDALWTHEIALDDTSEIFDLFKQSDCVKVLIKI